jgi:hypothetical protein
MLLPGPAAGLFTAREAKVRIIACSSIIICAKSGKNGREKKQRRADRRQRVERGGSGEEERGEG